MNKKIRRILVIVTLSIFVTLFLFWVYGSYILYKGNKEHLRKREETFRAQPTLLRSLVLMDEFYWELKQYDKANYYADYCLKLDAEKTRRGWYVHMVKADLEAKKKDIEQACYNLNLGLEMAKQYKISTVQINWFKYQDLLNTCTAREKK